MIPVEFEGANMVIQKPESMTDEECASISVYRDETGFTEHWMPSKEDIEAINAGRGIWVKILMNVLPPVAMWTQDENNEIN